MDGGFTGVDATEMGRVKIKRQGEANYGLMTVNRMGTETGKQRTNGCPYLKQTGMPLGF